MELWNSKDYEKYSLECPKDRTGFITKVYSILSAQLLITFFFVLLSCESKSYQLFVKQNTWIFIVCSLFAVFLLFLLCCFRSINRTAPYNFLLLSVFTICKALAVSAICAYYDDYLVIISVLATFLMTAALTGYAWTTKTDFTMMRGFMVISAFLVFFMFLMCWRLGLKTAYHYMYCPLAVGLYGIYLIYDTQLIIGEKRHKLSYDDYILGSVMLYVDVVGIFIHLLKINKRK
jgi:FtsH-binding integral membrane protein